MQKGVLHQKQPYGLPLRFTTLSQKLKEAGKSIITLYYYIWACLKRTGNNQIQEFDELKSILTAV